MAATTNGSNTTPKARLHGRAFYESIGSPKYVLAPMVDQSEFAWRMLVRSYLKPEEQTNLLCYTPMFHARLFAEGAKYRDAHFEPTKPAPSPSESTAPNEPRTVPHLDGNPDIDRPLFVQFCANDPSFFASAASYAAPHCDAIDLNLGCPQGIARKGHYGAFLQEQQDLIHSLIKTVHESPEAEISAPITAKIRILETHEKTLAYAKNVLSAGASILAVHGRRREQKGHLTGLADWAAIRRLRNDLPKETVLFANGNILRHEDLEKCREATGADAVLSAEGALSDPAIFATPPPHGQEAREYWRGIDGKGGWRVDGIVRRYVDILYKHVFNLPVPSRRPLWVPGGDEEWFISDRPTRDTDEDDGPAKKKRKTSKKSERVISPNFAGVQAHLFHLLRHFITRHIDVRDQLARLRGYDREALDKLLEVLERKCAEGIREYHNTNGESWALEEGELDRKTIEKLGKKGSVKNGEGGEVQEAVSGAEVGGVAEEQESSLEVVRACRRPWWIAQPIVRPLPTEAMALGSVHKSKKQIKEEAKAKENGCETGAKPVTAEVTA